MKDISEKRLSDYMAEQIADEILSGRIPGGSQLKQEELAEAFEASRIPIREAFQILENQGLIIRLATRRITVTELDKEQICLIYSMISEMTKKALNSLKHSGKTAQLEELLMTSGLSGEVQPAEAMCDLVENEYIKRLLRNASDSYIRFALSTGHYADKIKEEKISPAVGVTDRHLLRVPSLGEMTTIIAFLRISIELHMPFAALPTVLSVSICTLSSNTDDNQKVA